VHATPYSQVGSWRPSGAIIAIMHPIDALGARGGVARWQGLADAGVSRRSLGAAVAANEVVRAGRGVYALPRTQTPSGGRRSFRLKRLAEHWLDATQPR
jgi:hypothetical protein